MQEGSTDVATLLCTQSGWQHSSAGNWFWSASVGICIPMMVLLVVCKEGLGQRHPPGCVYHQHRACLSPVRPQSACGYLERELSITARYSRITRIRKSIEQDQSNPSSDMSSAASPPPMMQKSENYPSRSALAVFPALDTFLFPLNSMPVVTC